MWKGYAGNGFGIRAYRQKEGNRQRRVQLGIQVEEEGKSAFAKGMGVGGCVRKENGEGMTEKQRWYKRERRQNRQRDEVWRRKMWGIRLSTYVS